MLLFPKMTSWVIDREEKTLLPSVLEKSWLCLCVICWFIELTNCQLSLPAYKIFDILVYLYILFLCIYFLLKRSHLHFLVYIKHCNRHVIRPRDFHESWLFWPSWVRNKVWNYVQINEFYRHFCVVRVANIVAPITQLIYRLFEHVYAEIWSSSLKLASEAFLQFFAIFSSQKVVRTVKTLIQIVC